MMSINFRELMEKPLTLMAWFIILTILHNVLTGILDPLPAVFFIGFMAVFVMLMISVYRKNKFLFFTVLIFIAVFYMSRFV